MVPFINQAPNALAAPVDRSENDIEAMPWPADPFDSAMNRALAKDSNRTASEAGPHQPSNKPARQRIGSRSPADSASSASRTPSQRQVQTSTDSDALAPARANSSQHEEPSSAVIPRTPSAPASDANLPQPPTVSVLSFLLLPQEVASAQRGTSAAGEQGCTGTPACETSANRPDVGRSPALTIAQPGDGNSFLLAPTLPARGEGSSEQICDRVDALSSPPVAGSLAEPGARAVPRAPGDVARLASPEESSGSAATIAPGGINPEHTNAAGTDGPAPPEAAGLPAALGTLTTGADHAVAAILPANAPPVPLAPVPGNESPQALGTSAAQLDLPMKKAEKTQKTAELSEQNLPGDGLVTAGRAEPRIAEAHSTNSSADAEKLAVAANAGGIDNLNTSPTPTPAATNASSTDDARLSALERTHDLVAMHALRLTQTGNEALRVVLEPGSGTRLSLELRFNNGGIEAQALLHQGDFEFLSSHWAELQQRLEPRGVHLAALECPTPSTAGQQQFQQPGRQSGNEQPTRSAFAEFALDGSMVDSPAARRGRRKTYDGWETWA